MSRRAQALLFPLLAMAFAFIASPAPAQDLDQSIQELAKQLYERMASSRVKKVAVVEFPDLNGYQSSLGQFIAEELITALSLSAQPGQFDVVERRLLARVLKEQELTDSSLFDAESIARIGKILGIEALVTGSIADLGTEVKVNARAISVENAKIFAAAATRITKTDAVVQLMKQNAGSPTASAFPAAASPSRSGAQRSDVFFQNSFLRVEPQSASKSKDGKRITLALSIENTSAEELLLAVRYDTVYDRLPLLVDDQGNAASADDLVGLARQAHASDENAHYTMISPKSKTVITLSFVFGEPVTGRAISFSADLFRLTGERWSQFSIGLTNIQLSN